MAVNYLDTVTMFLPCSYDIRVLFTTHWIWDNQDKNKNLHHFCIKTDYAFLRFFPDMYGFRRLYITFSLPKLYHTSNSNTFNLHDYDDRHFMTILTAEMAKVMDVSKMSMKLEDWQPSRIDLFIMRTIDPVDRLEYHQGYSRLMYRGNMTTTFMNTNYLMSGKNNKHSSIILRSYNKTIEQQDKRSILIGNLPSTVEIEHEELMNSTDIPTDQFRYEFALRRSAIKRFCDKFNVPLNMATIMREKFQVYVLNELIISRGLHCHILCKNDYRCCVKRIFHWDSTADMALKLAESIRNRKPYPMKYHQRYRITRVLNSYFISTATTNFVSIKGLELLQ